MKAFLALISPLFLATVLAEETSFIRQIEFVNGVPVTTDIPVTSDSGEVTSDALSSDLGVFQLFTTWQNEDDITELIMLDEEAVGTFLPQVSVDVFSDDPHEPTTTRADQPYGVRVTVGGLKVAPTAPDYSKTVLVGRGYELYSPDSFTPTGDSGYYEDEWFAQSNGAFIDSAVTQKIPGGSPTRAVGAEVVSVYTQPDSGMSLKLATAKVIVWPVAIANFTGIEEGEVYYNLPSDSAIALKDAYPRSTTYATISKGSTKGNAGGTVISSTTTQFGSGGDNSEVPQDAAIPLGPLPDYIDTEGEYTINVWTVTPFNNQSPELLASISFVIDRTVTMKGTLYSADR